MKGFQIKLFVFALLLGIVSPGISVQTAKAWKGPFSFSKGPFFLSKCELCQEEDRGRQFIGSTYPWPRYSYHLYRGKRCDTRTLTGRYQRYEYDRYRVKSYQPIPGEVLPLPK